MRKNGGDDQKCVEIVGEDPVGFQGGKVPPAFLRENQFPGLSSSIILDSLRKIERTE